MSNLALANVFTVSVATPGATIGEFNTSNLGIISHEIPAESFGDDGYKLYLDPTEVIKDWGSDSITAKMSLAIFSQSPNILGPGGYLVIFHGITAVQGITFGSAPVSGGFKLNFGGNATATILYNDSASQVQAKLRAVLGLEQVVVTGTIGTGGGLSIKMPKFGPQALMTVSDNNMVNGGATPVVPVVATTTVGETLEDAIVRTNDLVEYFGIMGTALFSEDDILDAAALIQTLNKLLFVVSNDEDDVEEDGALDLLRQGGFTQTRGLFYGGTLLEALRFQAAYASRGLSVDFNASNSTITMHLKDLATILPDPEMDQTLLNKCQEAGVDVYVSIQGVAKTFTSGENLFFDRIYNRLWIIGAFKVAAFNLFASTPTKIPQTEDGMLMLSSALRKVCQLAVTNAFLAPGEWTEATTFGDAGDLRENVRQRGYYLYSAPVSEQSTAARAARQAPVMQAALKEAGANHKGSLIIFINA